METRQSNKTSERPLMHLVRNQDELRHIDETSVHVQGSRDGIPAANEEPSNIIQRASEEMARALEGALAATDQKNFRIYVEEEISITERPS